MSITMYTGKPGEGMQYRNRAQWQSIADFLSRQNLREVLERQCAAEASKRSAVAAAAQGAAQTLPVGNHGEIVAKGVGA